MKIEINTIIIVLLILLSNNNIYSQAEMGSSELLIKNKLSQDLGNIKVRIYPIGTIFGTGDRFNNTFMKYWMFADPDDHISNKFYITGGEKIVVPYIQSVDSIHRAGLFRIDQDGASSSVGCDLTIGYGKYQIDIMFDFGSGWQTIKTFTMDWSDSDYPEQVYDGNHFQSDIKIYVLDTNNIRIFYGGSNTEPYENYFFDFHDLSLFNNEIKIWQQYHKDEQGNDTFLIKIPNKNNFRTTDTLNNQFLFNLPINGTEYINSGEPMLFHNSPGLLNVNLEIQNNHHAKINSVNPFIVNDSAMLILKSASTYENNARLYIQDNGELRFRNAAALVINKYGSVIVEAGGKLVMENHSYITFRPYSEIRIKQGGLFCNEGARIKGNANIIYEGGSIHHIMCSSLADFVISDSAKVILDSNAVLEIPDSTTISFYGNRTGLVMHPNSVIRFGANSKLLFDSSATFIAKNATFTSLDTFGKWEGIVLQNTGEDSVINCTFSNAKTSLALINTPGHTFYSRVIKGNVFNVPSGGVESNGIYGENNFRITVQDNVFNMPANQSNRIFGVYLKNNNTTGVESLPDVNEGPAIPFSMFLINNTFYNGTASALLLNYTSSYLPFYVKGNTFNSASTAGIIGRNITGSIKDNVFSNSGSIIPMGIHLIASSPDLYNNVINSENVSLHTIGSSFPNLSPVVSGSSLIWKGGKNRFYSNQSDNIQLVHAGNVYTNLGENRFTVSDTSENRYHIFGRVDTTMQLYTSKINCWYPSGNPRICLKGKDTSEALMTGTGLTDIDCDREISANDLITEYLGIGVYDTIKQSPDTTGSELTEEELLYNQGQNYISAGMLIEGISALKNLIDDYIYFEDLPASVYDLYSCYEYLDTTEEQSYRNTLYGNLKLYLDNRINSEEGYDGEFISNAYNITLMCDANMLNYDDAANGYEFISLFHPDPDIRLNASWDYAEIEALMGGGYGGGEKDLGIGISDLELTKLKEINEMNRINEIINNDPVMMKVKEVYDKTIKESSERNERSGKQIKDNFNNEENSVISEQSIIERESDKFKNEKARRNIFELKNLSRLELEKRRVEDMLLSAKDTRSAEFENDETVSIPSDFELYQNYPNPFNPVTNVEFGISKSGFVTLKVYDVLGKEVATLVNEMKQAGDYKVDFNAVNFTSGIYFYKFEYLNFVQTKRMILIK